MTTTLQNENCESRLPQAGREAIGLHRRLASTPGNPHEPLVHRQRMSETVPGLRSKVLWLFLALFLSHPASGELWPGQYLRALTVSSDTVVIVNPVTGSSLPESGSDHEHQTSFHVEEVLKGDPKLASTTLRVWDGSRFVRRSVFDARIRGPENGGTQVEQAMLFLTKTNEGGWGLDHLYALTKDGDVVRPFQEINPGPYVLGEKCGLAWSDAQQIVRSFLPELEALKALRAIPDPSERNQALLGWIQDHKDEFHGYFLSAGTTNAEPRTGWGRLEHEVFLWILGAGIHEDSWLALQRHAETGSNPGSNPGASWAGLGGNGTFTNHSGRAFLLAKLLDPAQPLVARRTAAILLCSALNNGPLTATNPERNSVTPVDQAAILQECIPLASHEDSHLRRSVIRLLVAATDPFNDASRPQKNKLALPIIAKALMREQDNSLSACLPSDLNRLVDEKEWKEITGNDSRMCVTVSASQDAGKLQLQVNSQHLPAGAEMPVEIVLERLDKNSVVAETVTRTGVADHPKKWPEDRNNAAVILEPVPVHNLSSGTWRVRLKGISADPRKLPWTSWQTFFTIP